MDGVVIADADCRIIEFNPAAEVMFGVAKADVIGRDLADVVMPRTYRAAHRRALDRRRSDGATPVIGKRIEVEALRANGDVFPVELAITQVKVDGAVYFSAYLRDISPKKQAEAKLSAAKEVAETASRAKSDFLAIMSHEIRTPLNGVLGLLSLMTETVLSATQADYVERAQASAETLLTLISDILDVSKIEAGQLDLEEVAFDPLELVHEALTLVQASADRKGVALVVRSEAQVRRVVGDQTHIRQVLVNLIANAVKFTDDGEVAIHVSYDGRDLQYAVEDTGIGVAPDQHAFVFEPFTQGDGSLRRRHGGTGLGLAICRELVALMSGELGVNSEPGVGSRFWFRVPVASDVRAQDVAPVDFEPLENAALNGRILLAEDSQTNALVASTVLRARGARVDIVANGLEAVEAARQRSYDIIFMDVSMPEMDGLAATRAIRDLGGWAARVPVIAMTAHALRGDRERCLVAGMSGYLTKPIRRAQLVRSAHDWLAARSSRPATAREPEVALGPPGLDEAHIVREWGDDPEQYLRIAETFLRELADQRRRLRAHVGARRNADVAHIAHSLASAAANVGALALSVAARDMEDAAAQSSARDLEPWRKVLDAAAACTVKDLEHRLGGSS